MRLLVYNIAYGTGSPRTALELLGNAPSYLRTSDRYFRAIGHLVRHFSPDVAGFLEIDKGSFRTRGISQTAQLAKLLQNDPGKNFCSKYAPNSYLSKLPYCRYQTNALLVRNGWAEAEWMDFMPCGAKRLILGCRYEGINILLVHLALTYPVRQRQLEYLARLAADKEKVIVCGDFNTFKGSKELAKFRRISRLVSANIDHAPTYPARQPVKELDYIMHSKDLHLKNFRIIRFPGSDHLPLLAEFDC